MPSAPIVSRDSHERYFQRLQDSNEAVVSIDKWETPLEFVGNPFGRGMDSRNYVWMFRRKGIVDSTMAKRLGNCPQLIALRVIEGGDCDELCKEVRSSSKLKVFTLTDCELSDGGIQALSKMKQLELLVFNRTNCTDGQLAVLQDSLAKTYVIRCE